MPEPLIRSDEIDVARRLMDHFGTTVEDWIAVAHHVVTARADSSPYDPASASGLFGYIYGTRATRSLLVPKGYVQVREDNVEATYSADRHLKVIYQNADWAADPLRYPRAISAKGPASSRIVERNGWLFPEMEEEERRVESAAFREQTARSWFYLVSVDGDDVRSELSLPNPIVDNQFNGFIERIFILKPGDWASFRSPSMHDDVVGQDFDIRVTRK